MKRSGTTLIRVIWQAFHGAIGGALTGAILVLIADTELVLNFVVGGPPGPVLQFVIWGTIGGAVLGVVRGLGKDSLWMGIANINTGIIFMTFVGAILALQIEFYEVGWR
jgi:hypothetical protein